MLRRILPVTILCGGLLAGLALTPATAEARSYGGHSHYGNRGHSHYGNRGHSHYGNRGHSQRVGYGNRYGYNRNRQMYRGGGWGNMNRGGSWGNMNRGGGWGNMNRGGWGWNRLYRRW